MPRPPRIEFKNAWYHVINRGAAKKIIFPSDRFRQEFVSLLREISEEFRLNIHAYCLMDNHFHLLIETPFGNLNLAIQKLTSTYSRRHNKMLGIDGPLFKGRYKSILIAENSYLAHVSRYIHRNPVEAGMVVEAEKFKWSSLYHYCQPSKAYHWVLSKTVLKTVSPNGSLPEYLRFVKNPLVPSMREFYQSNRLPGILGSKALREVISMQTGYLDSWYPKDRPSLSKIANLVCFHLSGCESGIRNPCRGIQNIPKMATMFLGQTFGRYRLQEIGEFMKITPSAVSRSIARFREVHEPELQDALQAIRCAVAAA